MFSPFQQFSLLCWGYLGPFISFGFYIISIFLSLIMEKVSKQQICYKLSSFLPIILVLVLFSFFFFFSSPSLLTTLIALLSAMFLVTLTRKKVSPDRNIVQDDQKKLESQPSLDDDDDVTHTEVTKESETGKSHEQQAEAQIDSSFPSDSGSFNLSIIDKNLELNAQEYKQHADPDSGSSLPSDSESSTGSIKSEKGIKNDHKRNQNLLGISDSLAYDNDLVDDDDDEEEEDSLIEIKLPNSHFFGLADDEEPKQKLESNLPEFLPESIFKHKGLMELLEEINEINEDENLIEIDISIGSTKCQDLRVKQELAYYGDQCVLSD